MLVFQKGNYKVGLRSWLKKENEIHKQNRASDERNPQTIVTFGGGPLSITRNKQIQQETTEVLALEEKSMDPKDILRQYDILGEEDDGILIVRKKRKGSRWFSEDEIENMV